MRSPRRRWSSGSRPGASTSTNSVGRMPRPDVVSTASTRGASTVSSHAAGIPARVRGSAMLSRKIPGRTSSVRLSPLRSRSRGSEVASLTREIASSRLPRSTAISQVVAETSSCSEGPPAASSVTDVMFIPVGNASSRRTATVEGSTSASSARVRSSNSTSDSAPVGNARPKAIFRRGVKPVLTATGTAALRRARSHIRATSR